MPRNNLQSWWKTNLFGLLSTIARFILIFPWAIYYSYAERHWKLIRDNLELHSGLYNPLIVKGEEIAAKWGKIGFYWSLAVAFPALVMSVPFSLIFGFFDIVIAIFVSVAAYFQTSYVPHSLDACKHGDAHTFQLPPNTNESLFDAMGRLNATAVPGEKFCMNLVQEWQYGVSFSVIYTVFALINMFFCIRIFIRTHRSLHAEGKSFCTWFLDTASEIPRHFFMCICSIIYLLPVLIFRCLPASFKWRTRFARRQAAKTTQRVPTIHQVKLKMSALAGRHGQTAPNRMYYNNGELMPQSRLATFLSVYDILILITQDLHYTDIQSLSLTSKSVRDALFPSTTPSSSDRHASTVQRLAHFRLYTCDPLSKSTCYLCTAQICASCQRPRALKLTSLPWHLDNCVPYCKICFTRRHKTNVSARLKSHRCTCAPPHEQPRFVDRFLWTGMSTTYSSWQYATRMVCRECDVLLDDKMAEQRMVRTKAELKDPRRKGVNMCGGGRPGSAVNGSGCGEVLETGTRWWVCGGCRRECTNSCHLAWAKIEA